MRTDVAGGGVELLRKGVAGRKTARDALPQRDHHGARLRPQNSELFRFFQIRPAWSFGSAGRMQ